MKILVIGNGEIAKKLLNTNYIQGDKITILAKDESEILDIANLKNINTIIYDDLSPDFFKKLDIESYDIIVALTKSDKDNILSSMLVKSMGAGHVICVINQVESMKQLSYIRDYIGIDKIVNPNLETALALTDIIKSEINYQSDKFANGKIEVICHRIRSDKDLEDHKIKDIGSLATVLAIAVVRKGELIIPDGDFILKEDDYLYIMGLAKDIVKFNMKYFRFEQKSPKRNITVVGANEISAKLADIFEDDNLTIIDKDKEKCDKLIKNNSNSYVVHSNLKGADFFDLNEVDKSDIFICLTDNEELNIALCLMAKEYNIGKIFTKIQSKNYLKILDQLSINAVVNTQDIAANVILKGINKNRGVSTYLSFNGQAQILEIKLNGQSNLFDKTIEEAEIPKGILIGGIVREDSTVIIPRGKTKFIKGDTIVVFCKNENRKDLLKFMEEENQRGLLNYFSWWDDFMIKFNNDWDNLLEDEFKKEYYVNLRKLLISEYKSHEIFPPAGDIFNAFKYTAYNDVKVLILGQDPYHNYDQAQGLSFSVKDGIKIPPSLVNIFKELNDDLGVEIPQSGNLTNWTKQGIMLLNTTLTVRAHSPMSHSKIGWEIFTDRVIEILNDREKPLVFILWGNHAKSKEKLITNNRHLIIKGPHPSPLSAHRGFFGSKPFSRANKFLEENNIQPPSWKL